VLVGGDGTDVLNGGLGMDTADLSDRAGALVLRLQGANAATLTNGGTAEDTLRAIENVIGGSGNDTLTGDTFANTLSGGIGNDRLNGLTGSDVLDGGAGLDRFYFTTALGPTNVDTVRGFETGTDKIHLARAIFTNFSGQGAGTLSSNFFALEFAADADDFIIYDPFNDTLYYDADGSGAGAEIVVARVLTGGVLSASDFVLQ
jgi:Ca2+-binding RTX toxin-like protein